MPKLRKSFFHSVNWISRTFFASRLSFSHVLAFLRHNSLRKLVNLARVHHEARQGVIHARSRPYLVVLEITNLCNLKCPFCLTGKGISGGREVRHMGYDEAKRIVDQVADTAYMLQLYTWGEPLLNKDVVEIIAHAKKKNLYVMLSTNATAMTPAYSERLVDSGIDYITVAIDGGSEETYRQYRVGGSYTKVLENVKALLAARSNRGVAHPFVEWQYVVFRHNEHEARTTEQMAYEIGVDKFTPLPAYVEDENWLPVGAEYRQSTVFNPERLRDCSRPWTHLNVRADGGVAPCCYEFFKKDDFGDLRQSDFPEIWNNARFHESRKLIGQASRGEILDDSSLICRDCLRTGLRPSFFPPDEKDSAPAITKVSVEQLRESCKG